MKTFILLVAVALTAGQQFQQTPDFNTAVRLAGQGFFQQGGSFSTGSSRNNNNQLQGASLQSGLNSVQNTGANFQSTSVTGSRSPSQSESFQRDNQFQSGITSFQQNQRNTLNSFDSSNRDQFQSQPLQQNQQNTFSSSSFQQDSGNPLQSTSFVSSSPQINSGNRLQNTLNQGDSGSQLQTSFNQQNTNSRLTPINVQLTPSNRFQSTSRQQTPGTSFQSTNNQQNTGTQFQQSNFNQQNPGSNNIQSNANNRFSSGSQSQSNNFQQSSSESSFNDFSEATNGVFEPLNLPSGASLLLGSISTSFSCIDRPYGYYADQENSCRIFHVCNPALFADGQIQTYQYSFMCGEGTVFDQNEMTCKMEFDATPCQEATNFYFRNEQFGRIEDRSF